MWHVKFNTKSLAHSPKHTCCTEEKNCSIYRLCILFTDKKRYMSVFKVVTFYSQNPPPHTIPFIFHFVYASVPLLHPQSPMHHLHHFVSSFLVHRFLSSQFTSNLKQQYVANAHAKILSTGLCFLVFHCQHCFTYTQTLTLQCMHALCKIKSM